MLTISNPKLPATASAFSNGATVAIIDTPASNGYAPLTQVGSRKSEVGSNENIEIPTTSVSSIGITTTTVTSIPSGAQNILIESVVPQYTGNTIEVAIVGIEIRDVAAIEIAGIIYIPAINPAAIAPGQFFYNPYTNTVQIAFPTTNYAFFAAGQSPLRITNYSLPRPPSGSLIKLILEAGIKTDYVEPPYPAIFEMLPLEGTFKWSLSWEGHPSGDFNFRTLALFKGAVIQSLTVGTEFNAYGVGFRVSGLSITEIPASLEPLMMIMVSVSLGDRHENYTERVVPLRQINNSNLDNIPDCLGDLTEAQRASFNFVTRTSVAELAVRAGDRFIGPAMSVIIPTGTPSTEGTTFISKAQEHIRIHGCFLRYSEPDAVKAIALNAVMTWTFQETDLRSPVQSSIAGRKVKPFLGAAFHPPSLGFILPSTPTSTPSPTLHSEDQSVYPYVNTYEPVHKLEGAFVDYLSLRSNLTGEVTQGGAPTYLVPNWKRKPPVRREIPEGDLNPELPPTNTGLLKDISNLFSQSGITKTYKLTVTEDDQPISEIQTRWGFVFLVKDMYQVNGETKTLVGAPTSCWKQVEEKRTTYSYDKQTGYALGSTTTGWELIRFEEETVDGENTLTLDPSDPEDNFKQQKKYELFEYFRNPYIREERHLLEPHSKYFKETELPPVNFCKLLSPSGQYQLFAIDDPNFTEPYFSQLTSSYENSFKSRVDPDNDATADPPLVLQPKTTGKESFNRTAVTINGSTNLRTLGSGDYGIKEDSFNTYESQFSAQDASYANSSEQTTFKRDSGRPGVHNRKAEVFELLEPENQIGIPRQGRNLNNYFAYTQVGEYPVNPNGILASSLQGGSLSYPAATTLLQAQTAAQTEITIANIRDVLQESFTIPFSPQIKDGDRLNYTCNGEIRLRRVLSISHEVEIKGMIDSIPIVTSKGSQVSVGLEKTTPVQFKTEPKPRLNLRGFYNSNTQTLGGVVDLKIETRRNF